MSRLSDDLREAAQLLLQADFDFNNEAASKAEALSGVLRSHAEILDDLQGRMARDLFREGPVPRFICDRWMETLSAGSLA